MTLGLQGRFDEEVNHQGTKFTKTKTIRSLASPVFFFLSFVSFVSWWFTGFVSSWSLERALVRLRNSIFQAAPLAGRGRLHFAARPAMMEPRARAARSHGLNWLSPMSDPSSRVAVYTGSFDPITLGHLNIIERASTLVDKLVVGIGLNAGKNPMFSPEERLELVERVTRRFPNVEVRIFAGLAVNFVRECGTRVMIRGVRPLQDLEAELTMMVANRQLDPGIETVVLMADKEFSHVSSSLIKQIAPLASDDELSHFVPPEVISAMRVKMAETETCDR
jgi:pantetheine-phosphate adenylyltransferase